MGTYWDDFMNKKIEERKEYFLITPINRILEDFYYYLKCVCGVIKE